MKHTGIDNNNIPFLQMIPARPDFHVISLVQRHNDFNRRMPVLREIFVLFVMKQPDTEGISIIDCFVFSIQTLYHSFTFCTIYVQIYHNLNVCSSQFLYADIAYFSAIF